AITRKKKPPSGGLVFFQFFNSNIGYFCMCYLRPYHPVVIAVVDVGFAPIFPDTCYHLTHYWLAAVDIPV
ncbi:hypothetical protein JZL84_25610, partial [Escherichia coli]|nr:hypothetical protein [Escherichia coli]